LEETAAALARLIAEGKIRHVGVSNFDVEQMETFGGTLPAEAPQAPDDLFRRGIEAEVLLYTEAHDIGVLVYGSLAHGLLSGRLGPGTRFARDDWRSRSPMFQGETYARNLRVAFELGALATELGFTLPELAVGWTLANPAVHGAIVGTRDRDHVDEAVATDLDDAVMQRIDALVVDAVPVAGSSPEGM
jgi:aryl-alcohol dehydrogenase-like predicted oxidoreductase